MLKSFNQDMYFDTHTHYNCEEYEGRLDEIFSGLYSSGVRQILIAGWDHESSERACAIAAKESSAISAGDDLEKVCAISAGDAIDMPRVMADDDSPGRLRVLAAAGIHPLYIGDDIPACIDRIAKLVEIHKVSAIGEIGLDYRKKDIDRGRQRECFEAQLELCESHSLPAVVHSLDAAGDTLDIIRRHPGVRGVIHGFSSSAEVALECCRLGWHIGIGTAVRREGARRIQEVVRALPMERMLAETDCPYRPVKGVASVIRGLADSLQIRAIAARIASIKALPPEAASRMLYENAVGLFM